MNTLPSNPDPDSVHHRPGLAGLLQCLRLDHAYDTAEGHRLTGHTAEGLPVCVTDFVGGFGAALLGHHPPVLREATRAFLQNRRPVFAQGSRSVEAESLAVELNHRCGGDYVVLFFNSGSEAVEAALRHALMETGGDTFITLEHAFHGHTAGARQVSHPSRSDPGPGTPFKVVRVPANDIARLEQAFNDTSHLAGFIAEPIQGEGGVSPLTPGYWQAAARLCRRYGVPLIADECQSGCGRTGTFLAGSELGARADYVLLSKALGGGLAKIAALLIDRRRHQPEMDWMHGSTFAGDAFSCAIARSALAAMDDSAMKQVQTRGADLGNRLQRLAQRYPSVIAEVRGRGLMWGLEFHEPVDSPSWTLRQVAESRSLVRLIAGYLLHHHRLRVLPTLGAPDVLRLLPPCTMGASEFDALEHGLTEVCALLQDHHAGRLLQHLGNGAYPQSALALTAQALPVRSPDRAKLPAIGRRNVPVPRVGWLCHLVDDQGLADLEPAFADWSPRQRETLVACNLPVARPTPLAPTKVTDTRGQVLEFQPILLPFTSRQARRALDTGTTAPLVNLIQHGVEAAHDLGCSGVALGQFTSILSRNGLRVKSSTGFLSTGNTATTALALDAVLDAVQQTHRTASELTLAVLGAAGNIGRACAQLLAPHFRRVILIGRDGATSRQRLEALASALDSASIEITRHPNAVNRADVIVTAWNVADGPLDPEGLRPGAIICDLSAPTAFPGNTAELRPDVAWFRGGVARLPGGESLGIPGFPLPAGQAFGCMAEAMILGWNPDRQGTHVGRIAPSNVQDMGRLMALHGLTLAAPRTFDSLPFPGKELPHACIS